MDNFVEYDPFFSLQYENEREKAEHRRSRKSNRRVVQRNKAKLPMTAKRFGKKMLHRQNRRRSDPYYKGSKYSFSSILWDMT